MGTLENKLKAEEHKWFEGLRKTDPTAFFTLTLLSEIADQLVDIAQQLRDSKNL